MSTPTATVLRPTAGPRIGWLPIALVFVVGTTLGAIGSVSMITLTQGDSGGPVAPEPAAANTELTRLLGNMDAAARRGDTRLFIEFRQDLVELIGTAGAARYEALRGIDSAEE